MSEVAWDFSRNTPSALRASEERLRGLHLVDNIVCWEPLPYVPAVSVEDYSRLGYGSVYFINSDPDEGELVAIYPVESSKATNG